MVVMIILMIWYYYYGCYGGVGGWISSNGGDCGHLCDGKRDRPIHVAIIFERMVLNVKW